MSDDVRRAKFQRDAVWNFASLAVLGVSGVALNLLISYPDVTTASSISCSRGRCSTHARTIDVSY